MSGMTPIGTVTVGTPRWRMARLPLATHTPLLQAMSADAGSTSALAGPTSATVGNTTTSSPNRSIQSSRSIRRVCSSPRSPSGTVLIWSHGVMPRSAIFTYSSMPAARSPSRLGRVPGSCGKIFGPSTSTRRFNLGSPLACRKSSNAHAVRSHNSWCRNSLETKPRLYTVGAPGRSPSQLETSGKSHSITSAPAASSALRASSQSPITEGRVLMRCPVGPPMPGACAVPASGSALMYIRGMPKRLPASAAQLAASA
ncbi:hypothetical protein D9M71_561010 [compost metagenome]